MTTIDRFDPFEQRITAAIDQIAAARRPDYLDDILRQTARTSQRPRWTFPARWLPMDVPLARFGPAARLPGRPLLLLAIVGLLVALAAISIVGSRNRVPEPFGLAGNGALAYVVDGDIYVRDQLGGEGRLLVDGARGTLAALIAPYFSPDGRRLAFAEHQVGGDYLTVANADGSNPRRVLDASIDREGISDWAWSADSNTIAVTGEFNAQRRLYLVSADGSGAQEVDLGGLEALDVEWSPTDPNVLLIRAQRRVQLRQVDLFLADATGGNLRPFGLPGQTSFGPAYTNSGAVWSLDGRTIAYNAIVVDRATLATHFRVHLLDADGTGERAVPVPGPEDPLVQEAWPVYSPDGKWILVHRWTWKDNPTDKGGHGWLAVMPADGSAPARDIGPRIPGGEDTGLGKIWSPDGTRVLMRAENTRRVYSIDPVTGEHEELSWTAELPDWQRVAP